MLEQAFLDGVPVEPGDRAQPAGDSGPGPAAGLQVAGETLDVGPAGLEQVQVVQLAPGSELPQVQRVGLPRQRAGPLSWSRYHGESAAACLTPPGFIQIDYGTTPVPLENLNE